MKKKAITPREDLTTDSKDDLNRIVWSTDKVIEVTDQIRMGYKPKSNPFWYTKPNWREANVTFEYTKEELAIIERCKTDILYFANKFCYAMTETGLENITLRDYQEELLLNYKLNRFTVVLASRQAGKTVSAAIFLAWFALFHYDKNSLVVANKGKTVKEIITKTKSVLQYLPFYLKPGIVVNNKTAMAFDNGSRIVGETASATPALGFTIHTIYADEFANINSNIVDSYYKSIYPTLSSSKEGKMIITSTANGRNKFFEIYNDAVNKESQFKHIRIDWWQVPGRDEEWRRNEIANLGSVESFRQEFGNSFDITNQSLFSGSHLKRMKKTISSYKFEQFDILDAWGIDYENLEWYNNFNIESLADKRKFFVVGVDLSEGLGGNSDKTVFNIFQMIPMLSTHIKYLPSPTHIKDLFSLKQVGIYTSNTISIKNAAKFLYLLTYEISTPDNMRLAIEYNNYGRELIGHLPVVCENINDFGIESVLQFHHQINSIIRKAGLRLNRGNKSKYVVSIRKNFEQGRLHFTHNGVFKEGQEFGKSRGKWESQRGKDDIIMSVVQVNSLFETLAFEEFVELYFDCLPQNKQLEISDKIEKSPNSISNMIENETDMYDILNEALGNTGPIDKNIDLSFM